MSPYNVRLNKVFNEVKNYVYSQRKRYGYTCVCVDPTDFNSVSRYFGGSLDWEEKNDLINLIENRMRGIDYVEHGSNDSICVWF